MSRIDSTYFQHGHRRLPDINAGVGVPTALYTEQTAELTWFINRYEPEIFRLILGDELYAEYISCFETVEKWITFDALLFDETNLESPIADYIFLKYWEDADTVAKDGTWIVNGDGKGRIPSTVRLLQVQHDMVEKILTIVNFLSENHDIYCATFEYNYKGWSQFVVFSEEDGVFVPLYRNSFGL